MNPKIYFIWFKILPKVCPMEMEVTYITFDHSVAYTSGKTISLIELFALKIISLVPGVVFFFYS